MTIFIATLLAAAASSPAQKGVDAGNSKMMESTAKHDAAGMASIYADDAILLAPNMPRSKGRAAIQQTWQGMLDHGANHVDLKTDDLVTSGNLAVETGTYNVSGSAGGNNWSDTGKYLVVWRKDAKGKWSILRDIFNSDSPPPAPAPQAAK